MNAIKMIEDMLSDYTPTKFNYDLQKHFNLRELGLDSLDQMELFYYLRDKLDISSEIQHNCSVEQIVQFVENNARVKSYDSV